MLCNCPPSEAERLAETLVREGLAACVNILPGVTSVYVWEGRLERDTESTLLIKVSAQRVVALRERLSELHPYDTVEIVSLPVQVAESEPSYVAWVRAASKLEA